MLLPAYVGALPGDTAKFYFFELGAGTGAVLAAVVGAAGLVFVAPWVTLGLAQLQVVVARVLLGPPASEVHARQVARLETSRTAPSTAPRTSAGGSNATSTTWPSSASWRWPPTSAWPARS